MRKVLVPPLLLVLCLLGMFATARLLSATYWLAPPYDSIGYTLIGLGILLPVWSARIFRKRETNILPFRDPDKLVSEGPFKVSRNPMYLGMLLVLAGAAIKLGTLESLGFVALFFSVANWWYIPFEEERMQKAFGDQFEDYKSQVRRWI